MIYLVAVVTVIFAVLRMVLPSSGHVNHDDIFKDLAHLYVGGMFGAAIAWTYVAVVPSRIRQFSPTYSEAIAVVDFRERAATYAVVFWVIAIVLCVVEGAVFFTKWT